VIFDIGNLRYRRSLDLTSIYDIEVFDIEGDLDIWEARIQMRDSAVVACLLGSATGNPLTSICNR
jgi:hypothetical protein